MDNIEMEELIDKCTNKFWKKFCAVSPDLMGYVTFDELKSEAYMAAVESMESFKYDRPMEFWIARAISNSLKNYVRDEVKHHFDRYSDDISEFWQVTGDPGDTYDVMSLGVDLLSPEELEILKLLNEGYTRREIKEKLEIGSDKIKESVDSILTKLT